MRNVLIACVFAALALGSSSPKLRVLVKSNHVTRAFSSTGEKHIQVRRVLLDAAMPNDQKRKAEVYIFFDPAERFFDWVFTLTGREPDPNASLPEDLTSRSESTALYAAKDSMVAFEMLVAPPRLLVYVSRERAQTLDEAEAKSLAGVAAREDFGLWRQHWKSISIAQVGLDFFVPKGSATFGPFRILQVSKQEAGWEITVEAQWREKIMLNDKFELVSMTRVD